MNLAMIVFSALMIWKGFMAATGSDSPVVVVLSGSMEPAFQRGDILLLDNNKDDIHVGDIVVFKIAGACPDKTGARLSRTLSVGRYCCTPRCTPAHSLNHGRTPRTGREIPIVHRVLRVHAHRGAHGDGSVDYLTKGDNNKIDDRDLYAPGQLWLKRSEIIGRAIASVPYVGAVTILLNDYPPLKVALVAIMALFVLTGKET